MPELELVSSIEGPPDAPVLVLGNPIGTTRDVWTHQVPVLSRHFRVLRYEPRGHGAPQAERVQRLDQPTVGFGPAGEEDVGLSIEQDQDAALVEPSGALLEAQVEAGGDAAHVADLQVEQDDVGVDLGHRGPDIGTLADPIDGVRAPEGRVDRVEDRVGIGGDEHAWHEDGA